MYGMVWQWDTVDLAPLPSSVPKNEEKRGIEVEEKVEIEKSKVHQTNSTAISQKSYLSQVPITGSEVYRQWCQVFPILDSHDGPL